MLTAVCAVSLRAALFLGPKLLRAGAALDAARLRRALGVHFALLFPALALLVICRAWAAYTPAQGPLALGGVVVAAVWMAMSGVLELPAAGKWMTHLVAAALLVGVVTGETTRDRNAARGDRRDQALSGVKSSDGRPSRWSYVFRTRHASR